VEYVVFVATGKAWYVMRSDKVGDNGYELSGIQDRTGNKF
jgi:hypothetical protein